jgi:ankyrin repeat protein
MLVNFQTRDTRGQNQDILNEGFLRAVEEGDLSSACRCLSQGALLNARGKSAKTALICAAEKGHADIVALLIEAKAHLNAQDRDGYTALIYAVKNGDIVLARRLIDAGADITPENKDGHQALYYAFKTGNPDMVESFERPLKQLLQRIPGVRHRRRAEESDRQSADPHGDTMLTWAARMGQTNVVRALLDSGANTDVRNKAGQKALDIARERNHLDIVNILTEVSGNA